MTDRNTCQQTDVLKCRLKEKDSMKVKSLERVGNKLRILDQRRLPVEQAYLDLDDFHSIVDAIKTLKIRGAPAIGIAAAYALAVAAHQTENPGIDYLTQVGAELKASRPTAVNLAGAVDRVLASLGGKTDIPVAALREHLWHEAETIHEEDRQMCKAIGRNGAELIEDGWTILTHCHTGALATGGIGTAAGIIYTARDQGKKLKVYADETRPLLQGARLTAWEMMQEGIDVTLICDSTAGMLMHQGKVDCVLVGADRIARNGDTANKIGTYSLVVLAHENDVRFYVAAPETTFDGSIESGDQIVLEERGDDEVTCGFGSRTAPSGVKVYAPAFDVTPARYITAFITDNGVIKLP